MTQLRRHECDDPGRTASRSASQFWRGCLAVVLTCLLAIALPIGTVLAQDVPEGFEIGLSTDQIGITSDFTGARLVVFGALDNADPLILRQQRYDIVVALYGPRRPVVVRKKERVFGIWINNGAEDFDAPPASYSLAATRPLGDITRASVRQRLSIGVDDLRLNSKLPVLRQGRVEPVPGPDAEDASLTEAPEGEAEAKAGPAVEESEGSTLNRDEYATALRRIRLATGLYNESIGTVEFVSPTLFRAELRLPADLPVGQHTVRAFLFRNGVLIRQSTDNLQVVKTGFESFISDFAKEHAFLYGVFAVALAIFTGWFGRIVFKRD